MEKGIESYILSGYAGAGKGTAIEYLQKATGGNIYRIGSILRDALKTLGLSTQRENYMQVRNALFQTFGMQIYCDLVKEFIDHQDHGVIIFDGLRDTMVIDEICRLTQAKVIFIEVLPQIRYERVLKRGEKAGEHLLSYEAFLTHDTIPGESALLPIVRECADFKIGNNGNIFQLHKQLEDVIHAPFPATHDSHRHII